MTHRKAYPQLGCALGFILDDDEVVDDLPAGDAFVYDHVGDGGEGKEEPRRRKRDAARWC